MFFRKKKQEIGLEQPNDYTYNDVPIGKWTYFGEGVTGALDNGYIARIGRFTSINGEAQIHVNHQSNMIFQSDELVHVFSGAQKVAYKARMLQDPKLPGTPNKSHKLEIGADVWIGANSFINCSRVKSIGHGAVIGAGAVVLHDVPPYAVVTGVPARVLRYRYSPEQIETLLRVRWWEWDDATIRENAELLLEPENFFARYQQH